MPASPGAPCASFYERKGDELEVGVTSTRSGELVISAIVHGKVERRDDTRFSGSIIYEFPNGAGVSSMLVAEYTPGPDSPYDCSMQPGP